MATTWGKHAELEYLTTSGLPTGASDKVMMYASGSGSNTKLYVKMGANSATTVSTGTLSLDIDGLTDGTGITLATSDKVAVSDGGTEKYITANQLQVVTANPPSADGDALGTTGLEWSDLYLADSSVVYFGNDQDVTLTHTDGSGLALNSTMKLGFGGNFNAYIQHDGTDLKIYDDADINLVAAADILLDAATTVILDSAAGDISFRDAGTEQLAIDMDGTGGEIIMQLKVNSDDFVFKQYDGTEVFRVEDDGSFDIAGGLGSSGVTVTSAGALSADGRIVTDDTTAATSTTDGSLQTDGGLSVALDAVVGDDLILLSDSAQIAFGADSEITLAHVADTGLLMASSVTAVPVFELKNTNADATGATLKFTMSGSTAADDDVIGNIDFIGGDSAFNATTYARILAQSDDVTSGAEEGSLEFYVAEYDGTLTKGMDIKGLGSNGDVTVDISTHDGSAGGLMLAGTLITKTAAQINNLISTSAANTFTADQIFGGTTPKITIGDGGAEDTMLAFDGNATDFRIGLDDGTDKVEFGTGTAHGTTTAMTIDTSQQVAIVATTAASSTSTGALTVAGGASVAADLYVGDDAYLLSDSAVLGFGADKDVTLTHTHNEGLLLNGNMGLAFLDGDAVVSSSTSGQLDLDGDGEVEITAPTLDIDASTAVLMTTPSFVIDSSTSEKPVVTIKNTNADAEGAELKFHHDSSSAADDDALGIISFYGDDSAGNATEMAAIGGQCTDVTNGDEGGKLTFEVMAAGKAGTAALKELLTIGGEDVANSTQCEVVVNEAGMDCDFRVESTNNTAMFYLDADNERVGIGTNGAGDIAAVFEVRIDSNADDTGFLLDCNETAGIAFKIEAANIAHDVIDITADAVTTANIMDVTADALTTGKILNLISNASGTGNRQLVLIHNDHASATGADCLVVTNDSSGFGLDVNAQQNIFYSSTASKPEVKMTNTANDSTAATLDFSNLRNDDSTGVGADGDAIGYITFKAKNDGAAVSDVGQTIEFASIAAEIDDASDGSEDGKLEIKCMVAGSTQDIAVFNDGTYGITLANNSQYGVVKAHSLVTYSDETLKNNIITLTSPIDKVKSLRGVSYDWKSDGSSDIGFIAQEVLSVVPEVVYGSPEAGGYGLDYGSMTALLVEAIKAQQIEIDELKSLLK
jgi:hypothetical protein